MLSEKLIKACIEKKLEINTWTVNGEKNLKKILNDKRISSVITTDDQLEQKLRTKIDIT